MAETPLAGRWSRVRETTRFGALAARLAWPGAVIAVVALGAVLRFHGLGWDQPDGADVPLQMQPDERFLSIVSEKIDWPSGISEYFDTAASPLNPYNAPETPSFVYGTFPLFLSKAAANLPGNLICDGDGYSTTVICGRRITAAVDTLTIVLVFALGALLFERRIGLLAALLYALAVLPTQLAHFWAVDPYVVFFGVATAVLSVLLVQTGMRPTARSDPGIGRPEAMRTVVLVAALGLCIGLGLASKVTAWPLTLGPVVATAIRIGLRDAGRLGLRWKHERPALAGHWMWDVSALCFVALATIVVFRVAQPYAFAGPHWWDLGLNGQWRADVEREVDFQNGNVDFPPFVQFAGRTPFVWPLLNLVFWGTGPALGIAAGLAAASAALLLFKRRELGFLLPLAMVAAVIGFQGPRFVAYMRYFAPAYPMLCLFAAWGLAAVVSWSRRWQPPPSPIPVVGLDEEEGELGWEAPTPAADGAAGSPPLGASPGTTLGVEPAARPGWPQLLGDIRSDLRTGRWLARAAMAAVIVVVGATAWWAAAFQNVYIAEHPRIAASEWIYANVPPGSTITGEIWDDTLPYAVPGEDPSRYPLINLYPFDTDSAAKVRALVYGQANETDRGLNGADYVAVSSNRVRDAVSRLEREYPATIRYYELLDSGELGFDLVATFGVEPSFMGLSVDDSGAEESFTVYDHPEVRIYRKSARWDPVKAVALLDAAHPERAINLLPRQGGTNGLQFTAAEASVQQAGGTFSDAFDADGLTEHLPWVWWLAWLQLAAFATLPWLTWICRALPDRGYGLSKAIGLASVGLVTWLTVAWGAAGFSGQLAWAAFALVLAAGVGTGWFRRASLADDLRQRWPAWAATEVAFLVAFFAFLAIRYANPDLWYNPQGGEKPVELAYLTAVARSTAMPPYDPWFAGGTMNYYYMGWFLLAVPIRALRLLPEVGFNLGIPTYAGLAAAVSFSTVLNLVGMATRARAPTPRHWRWRPALLAAAVGVVVFMAVGNLDGAHQTIERLQALNPWDTAWGTGPSGAWDTPLLGEPLRLLARMAGGTVGLFAGLWEWLFRDAMMTPFDWWRPSRVHFGYFDITEFPWWTFLFGDLHAHMMGLPFFGLVIALVVAYVSSAVQGLKRHTFVLAAMMGIAIGLVRTIHTWDFPTSILLVGSGILAGQLLTHGRWQQRWWDGVAHTALAGLFLLVPFAPYTAHFEVFESGLQRSLETTQTNQYLAHFGLFVAAGVAFVLVRYAEELRWRGGARGNAVLALVAGRRELVALALLLTGLGAYSWQGSFFSASWSGLTTIAFSAVALVFLFNLLWLDYRKPRPDVPRILATAMFAAAVGIAGGVDVVQAQNDIQRMNTVFKFSLEAWQLYALATGFAAWYVGRYLWRAEGWVVTARPGRSFAGSVTAIVAVGLIFGASIYTFSGTRARQEARFEGTPSGTLNGLAYLDYGTFPEDAGTTNPKDDALITLGDDKPLINWLRENVEGSPVIAEAVGPLYHWTGRISWNTGLPAVVGWDWHEIAYRMDYAGLVDRRRQDTARFFADPSVAWARIYLQKYNVSYVVVGTEEHIFGTPEGLAKFDQMPELTPVFRSGTYVIYRYAQP